MGLVSRLVAALCATLVLLAGLEAQGRDDFDLGLGLYERGLFEEAAKSFEHHLDAHPKGDRSTEAWYRLASCRKKLGKKKTAREAFLRVLSGDARFRHRAETRYQLGELLQEARQQAQAAIQFEKLLEGPAWCAFELGDIEACRKHGRAALNRSVARKMGAGLRQLLCSVELNEKRWKAAEGMALEFLRTHPEDKRVAEMRFSLALAMARGGKSREAEKALEDLLEDGAGKHRDQVWYELAWTRRKLGKEKPALAAFRKVAETSHDPALRGEARLHLAESLLASGQKDLAMRELAKVEGAYRSRAL